MPAKRTAKPAKRKVPVPARVDEQLLADAKQAAGKGKFAGWLEDAMRAQLRGDSPEARLLAADPPAGPNPSDSTRARRRRPAPGSRSTEQVQPNFKRSKTDG